MAVRDPKTWPAGHPASPALRWLAAAALGFLTSIPGAGAQGDPPPLEYQVKAAFLFNFARFIDWPADSLDPGDPILVCVLDNDAFARALDLVVSGKTVEGRVLKVRRIQPGDDALACRIVYFGSRGPSRLSAFLKSGRAGAVLTVGDEPGFTRQGGIINFFMQDNRVHFEINPDAASRAGLRISSKLLQLATIVRDAREEER